MLLVFDEIQCGLCRTGTLWCYEQYGVTPDMMTLAKPLAGGFPIGATLMTQKVADAVDPGDHAATFGAHPVSCAGCDRGVQDAVRPGLYRSGQRE